jgi:hypothetical protein
MFIGASQGSGPCGQQYQFARLPPDFIVSLVAMNNIVDLNTYIDGNIPASADQDGSVSVQLTVDGFQDANGNPIAATLLPEPGTLGTFTYGFASGRRDEKETIRPRRALASKHVHDCYRSGRRNHSAPNHRIDPCGREAIMRGDMLTLPHNIKPELTADSTFVVLFAETDAELAGSFPPALRPVWNE